MESPSTKTEVIAEATVLNEELTVIQSQFTDKLHLWLKGLAGLRLTGSDATEIVNIVRATIRRAGRQMAYQDKPVNVLATNASHRKFASFQVRTVRPADPAVLHSATTFPELTTINIDHA